MPARKIWDHTIDLKEMFEPQKGMIYPLFKNERKEVQSFVKERGTSDYLNSLKYHQYSL